MKQADLGLSLPKKRTREHEFLDEMNRVVPCDALVELVAPRAPKGLLGWRPFAAEVLLCTHFMQRGFTLSEPRERYGQ